MVSFSFSKKVSKPQKSSIFTANEPEDSSQSLSTQKIEQLTPLAQDYAASGKFEAALRTFDQIINHFETQILDILQNSLKNSEFEQKIEDENSKPEKMDIEQQKDLKSNSSNSDKNLGQKKIF